MKEKGKESGTHYIYIPMTPPLPVSTCGDVVQGDHVRELVLLFHQIQLLRYAGVVLEPVLPHLEHHLQSIISQSLCLKLKSSVLG